MTDAQQFGSLQNKTNLSVSFTQYVMNAYRRGTGTEEFKTILKVFGMERIEKIIEQHLRKAS